jgi:SAM-dependent methyltransferase
VVTRELMRTLPDSVTITATDLSQPMLDRAQSRSGSERVRWQQADALALPFEGSSFDAIVCQFGVIFFANQQDAFREALRVLKPKGLFLFEVWDRREEVAIQYTASQIVGRALSLDPGSLLAPPYHDVTTVRSDLAAAGFTEITSERLPDRSRTGSAHEAAIATCQGGVLRSHIESHAPGRLEEITDAVAAALAKSLVRDRSTPQCKPSCLQRFARLRFNPNVFVEALKMKIRDAVPEDAPAACEVIRRSISELCGADHQNDPEWLATKTAEIVGSWIIKPGNSVLVAVEDGSIFAEGSALNYISPDSRFRGVSRAMLTALEARARTRR